MLVLNHPVAVEVTPGAARAEALAHAKPLASLAARHPNQKPALDAAVAKTGRPAAALVYIPMITFGEDWVALLDAAKGDVVGYAPLDGFCRRTQPPA